MRCEHESHVPVAMVGIRYLCRLQARFRRRLSTADEPLFEMRFSESRVRTGNKGRIADFNAVIARLRDSHDLTSILGGGQRSPHQFIEAKTFRTSEFHRAF